MHPVEALLVPLGRAFRNRHADEAASVTNAPELATSVHFALTSPNFTDGAEIPARYCGVFIGDNVSPALDWHGLPGGAVSLVLVMEDLNSPGTVPRIHTIAEFPATGGGIAEGALAAGAAGIRFVPRGKKPGGYAGPRPLPGHGAHHYRFTLYALDADVDLGAVEGAAQLPAALAGHVLASAVLTGTRAA